MPVGVGMSRKVNKSTLSLQHTYTTFSEKYVPPSYWHKYAVYSWLGEASVWFT